MKKNLLLVVLGLLISGISFAQPMSAQLEKNKLYKGAVASKKSYHAIYQLDSNDPKTIEKTIRNINNALGDPRLKGKLQIELIAFSGGTDAFLKGGKFEEQLKDLVSKNVIIAQCHNSLVERNLKPVDLYDFIAIVPSGNGELIIRAADGWVIIKP